MAGWTRPIKVVDASSVRLPDTAANRQDYPYPSGQRPGCGFPVMQFCGLYSLTVVSVKFSKLIDPVSIGEWLFLS